MNRRSYNGKLATLHRVYRARLSESLQTLAPVTNQKEFDCLFSYTKVQPKGHQPLTQPKL